MADARAALGSRLRPTVAVLALGIVISSLFMDSLLASEPRVRGVGDRAERRDYRFNRTERCFMRRINQRRVAHGRRPLRWDKQIGYVARRHARKMARRRAVWHDLRLGALVTRWRSLGQNTGGGAERCPAMFRRFWRSPGHRANILGVWRFIGVGTTWRRGRLYVQQVFEYRTNPGNVFGFP